MCNYEDTASGGVSQPKIENIKEMQSFVEKLRETGPDWAKSYYESDTDTDSNKSFLTNNRDRWEKPPQ